MTGWVLLDRATPISRHVAPFCVEAQEATYVREADLRAWAELPGKREPSRGMYGNVKRLFPLPRVPGHVFRGRSKTECERTCFKWILCSVLFCKLYLKQMMDQRNK